MRPCMWRAGRELRHSPSELKPELFRLTCVFRLLQNSPQPTGVHSSQQKALTTRLAKDYLLLIEGKLCSLLAVFLTLIVKRLFLVEKVKFCHFFWSWCHAGHREPDSLGVLWKAAEPKLLSRSCCRWKFASVTAAVHSLFSYSKLQRLVGGNFFLNGLKRESLLAYRPRCCSSEVKLCAHEP